MSGATRSLDAINAMFVHYLVYGTKSSPTGNTLICKYKQARLFFQSCHQYSRRLHQQAHHKADREGLGVDDGSTVMTRTRVLHRFTSEKLICEISWVVFSKSTSLTAPIGRHNVHRLIQQHTKAVGGWGCPDFKLPTCSIYIITY